MKSRRNLFYVALITILLWAGLTGVGRAQDEWLNKPFEQWSKARFAFNTEARVPNSAARKTGWQRHYFRGTSIDLKPAPEHQSRLLLREFVDKRK